MYQGPISQELRAIASQNLPPQDLRALIGQYTIKIEAAIAAQAREPDLWERVCLRRAAAAISAGRIKSALADLEAALQRPVFGSTIEVEAAI